MGVDVSKSVDQRLHVDILCVYMLLHYSCIFEYNI